MPTIATINRQLAAIHPLYSARFFDAEDSSVDASLDVYFAGQDTGWHLQIGAGYVGVNRLVGEGDDVKLHHLGMYRTHKMAFNRLYTLLAREKPYKQAEVQ